MFKKKYRIGVIGSGGWGLALALTAYNNKHEVTSWCYDQEDFEQISKHHVSDFLPGINLQGINFVPQTSISKACLDKDIIVLANPARYNRGILEDMRGFVNPQSIIVNISKGFDLNKMQLMSELIKEKLPANYQNANYLSGGSYADQLARKVFTAVNLACLNPNSQECQIVADAFSNQYFALFPTDDTIGVQLGGNLKNLIAIVAGILKGIATQFNDIKKIGKIDTNTWAALITIGVNEIIEFIQAFAQNRSYQIKAETFNSFAVIGDVTLTANDETSRNFSFGKAIGQGKLPKDLLASSKETIEGYYTCQGVYQEMSKLGLDLPVISGLYEVLHNNKPVNKIFKLTLSKIFRSKKIFNK